MARQDVAFESEGATLNAWLYAPDTRPPWPLVVMAHGYSATRGMVADRYAEFFCSHGLAALLLDHRGFGASGGSVRRQINPWVQARGYRDALRFASALDAAARLRQQAAGTRRRRGCHKLRPCSTSFQPSTVAGAR